MRTLSPLRPLLRPTLRGMMALIAVLTLLGVLATASLRERRARCHEIADNEARLAADYHRGAASLKSPVIDRIGAWHDHQAELYARAADRPWLPFPALRSAPPPDFAPLPDGSP